MQEETDQLPLARMMSINKLSFWIYFLACVVLFAYSMLSSHNPKADWEVPSLIGLSIFVALFLELISQRLKNEKTAGWLTNICYLFEAVSTLAFAFIIFSK